MMNLNCDNLVEKIKVLIDCNKTLKKDSFNLKNKLIENIDKVNKLYDKNSKIEEEKQKKCDQLKINLTNDSNIDNLIEIIHQLNECNKLNEKEVYLIILINYSFYFSYNVKLYLRYLNYSKIKKA